MPEIIRVKNRNECSMGGFVYFLTVNGETVGEMFSSIEACIEYANANNIADYTIKEERYM